MASATQNLGIPVQPMFHASRLCILTLKYKGTVGVNIRKGLLLSALISTPKVKLNDMRSIFCITLMGKLFSIFTALSAMD